MSSSIFSSNDEFKVVLVVIIVLLLCEIGVGFRSLKYLDVQHRQEIPLLVDTLCLGQNPRVLFLGNSLTRKGFREDSFAEQLAIHGYQVGGLCSIYPDDTNIRHWNYIFQRNFASRNGGQTADCCFITFVRDQLSDQTDVKWRRMALNTHGHDQIAHVLLHETDSIEHGVYYIAAHFTNAVAHQPDIKGGLLSRLIPNYVEETRRLNKIRLKASAKPHLKPVGPAYRSYEQLQNFIDLLKQSNCHGVFSQMPLPVEQTVDPKLVDTVVSNGMTFLDFRGLADQTKGHYPDGYHMDSEAADIYSRAVADAFSKELPNILIRKQ